MTDRNLAPNSEPNSEPNAEVDFVLDDVPVVPHTIESGTQSIVIVPERALAAGEDHRHRAALEAAQDGIPPLPDEPRPMSRYGRRFTGALTHPDQVAHEPYLKPRRGRPAPEGFWREYVYGVSLGLVNLGDSRRVRDRKAIHARMSRAVAPGAHLVPVISRQGGVGATTVTALLGLALTDVRTDVSAVDLHPDRGLLADRVAGSELTVGEDTPDGVVLVDAAHGNDLREALEGADAVVLVSGGTSEQARLASETVTWLHEQEFGELADNAVVAINTSTPGTRYDSLDQIEAHFQARVREVVRIPYDEELVGGAAARYAALRPDTREAARDLAAKLVDGLEVHDGVET